ncbi:hypothetical protein UlMin_041210 [Ulmus minor]
MKTTSSNLSLDLPAYSQNNELTEDIKQLLLSLPKEKSWILPHLYQYQGVWLPAEALHAVIACQKHFQSQDSDILLATHPKSGTTWLKAIMFALSNRAHYSDLKNHPLLTKSPHDLVPWLELYLNVEKHDQFPHISTLASPRLFATHLPYVLLPQSIKNSGCKLVYLCRNPKDTFVSLWHFSTKLKAKDTFSLEEAVDRYCRGATFCGPFWNHLLGYWQESLERSEKVLFLKYEEVKEQPTYHLKKIAEFIGCPFSLEEEEKGVIEDIASLCSFENLSSLEVNNSGKILLGFESKAFFRRGEVGDWKNCLTSEMAERLDLVTQENLYGSGLEF